MANATGLRVIAVDYPVAPGGTWQDGTAHVITVVKALLTEGYALKDMVIFGDAAGGSLAAGAVVQMRDQGLGMPAAVVLWAPWADITAPGATSTTLMAAEPGPLHDRAHILRCRRPERSTASLRVAGGRRRHQGLSAHPDPGQHEGHFSAQLPPPIPAIESAGGTVQLDLYEGMAHVFQPRLPQSPEGQLALTKMKQFLAQSLGHRTDAISPYRGAAGATPSARRALRVPSWSGFALRMPRKIARAS